MSKKSVFYIGFFATLVIIFYFFLTALIPDFGAKKSKKLSRVKPFSFINQDGKRFYRKRCSGKSICGRIFFYYLQSICPIMNTNMKIVYEQFKNEKDFLILSHTSDPETDSAARLKKYADSWEC